MEAPSLSVVDAALSRAVAAGRRPTHEAETIAVASAYAPWRAQRLLHRSTARWRILIAGRGAGKTFAAAKELLDIVLAAPSGSEGAILAPTLTHAEAAQKALREIAACLPGVEWRVVGRRLHLPGGRGIKVHHAEREQKTVRGPSLICLWVDEGALLSLVALESALPALRSRGNDTRLIVTTTPLGKNWVWDWFEEATKPESLGKFERFRFRSTESPYVDQFTVERSRQLMSPEFFAQEFLAEFVDSLLLVFPNLDGLFVDSLPVTPAPRGARWIGVDLGRKKDWSVATLMDEHHQATVLGRWREGSPGMPAATFWGATDARILELAKQHSAMVVIDTGGAGGSAGAVMAEALLRAGVPVLEVRTNVVSTKAQVFEQLKADVDWRRIRVLANVDAGALRHEMERFQGTQRVVHGQAIMIYEGPQLEGEHDDCVTSLALANWGRVKSEPSAPPSRLSSLVVSGRGGVARRGRGAGPRYVF